LNVDVLNSLTVLYEKTLKFVVVSSTKLQDLVNKLYERRSEADISIGMGGEDIESFVYNEDIHFLPVFVLELLR